MQGIPFFIDPQELNDLTSKYSDTEISKILGVAISTVFLNRKKHGILSFTQKAAQRKSRKDGRLLNPGEGVHHLDFLNSSYFETIDSEEKAYFLGLLATDGHVGKSKNALFMSIELQIEDRVVVESLATALNFHKECEILKREGKKDSVRIRVFSRDLVQSLLDKGMTFNTETHGCFLGMEHSLRRHFIRGSVDGDGSISAGKNLYLGSCSKNLIEPISKWLEEEKRFNICPNKRTLSSGKTFYRIGITPGKEAAEWLYQDCSISIPRKQKEASIWFSRY